MRVMLPESFPLFSLYYKTCYLNHILPTVYIMYKRQQHKEKNDQGITAKGLHIIQYLQMCFDFMHNDDVPVKQTFISMS